MLAAALPKFSKLATISLILVTATGLFNGLLELALNPVVQSARRPCSPPATACCSSARPCCAGLIALLGANIRWRLLPHIAQHKVDRDRGVGGDWSVTIMGVAFGLAVVLSRAPVS